MSGSQKSFFEPRFGRDFEDVRLHTGDEAADSAGDIQARAFTYGSDIVFGAGESSEGERGRRLLAHELTHVVQQGHAPGLGRSQNSSPASEARERVQRKKEKKDTRKGLQAQKQLWDDLSAFFPDDAGKIAGSGSDDAIDYLRTSLDRGTEEQSSSIPIIFVGKKYAGAKEKIRKKYLKKEIDGINSWLETKKAVAASAKFWTDLKAFFPDAGRKLAGSGYDASIDQLRTSFFSGEKEGTHYSAPMVYIGSKYLEEADDAKRQEWIRAELEKVDAWRFDEAYIDNLDLADSALKAKLEDLDAADKLSYIERLKAREKIDNADVVSYLQKVMQSTPIVAGATILETGGFELTIDNIKIVVLPDVYNSPQVGTGGETEIQTSTFGGSPAWTSKNGVIDSLTPGVPVVPTVTATIQTHYASDAGPRTVSGYGVGTRPGDTTTEEKSLRHHEGAHGSEFIKSIQAAAPTSQYPVYTGRIGDPVGSFQTAERAYKAAVAKFTTMVDTALENQIQNVDCVGKTTIVEYHQKKGTTTKVTCNP